MRKLEKYYFMISANKNLTQETWRIHQFMMTSTLAIFALGGKTTHVVVNPSNYLRAENIKKNST